MTPRGGRRPGAGRPRRGDVRISLRTDLDIYEAIAGYAERKRIDTNEAAKRLLAWGARLSRVHAPRNTGK